MCDRARLQADDERVLCGLVAKRCDQLADRDLQEDRDDRQEEEREGDGSRDRDTDCEEGAAHRFLGSSPNPALFRSRRPRFEVTLRMNALAPTLRGVELTIATW